MSFKNKLREKRERKSDRRRKQKKQERKLRIKGIKRENLEVRKIEHAPRVPELPEEIAVEKIVKNGARKGTISVGFAGHTYSITVAKIEETISESKVIYSVNGGRSVCATLEGFDKIISLNRERMTPTLARAV